MIKIKYYVDGTQFAERFKEHIPRKQELIRFNKQIYTVVNVVYIEDVSEGKDPFVSIDMVKETY